MFRLIITRDTETVNEALFDQGEVTIGRQQDNDICLQDTTVSGHHARLVERDTGAMLEDLGSTNGTYVDGKRVQRCDLRGAEIIVIGKHKLEYQPIPADVEGERRDPTQQLDRNELESLIATAMGNQSRSATLRNATTKTLNWIAQDSGGTWWGFENRPECKDNGWVDPQGGHRIRLKNERANGAWQDTLQKI
ncbi:MAG: FHA domain-containing protein [Gammaproteobacteria bacterium]|nr:FHA domain-containing protein [Gammaproteobacteria bacterium]